MMKSKSEKITRLDSIANGLGIKQNGSTISWDFKHNISKRQIRNILDIMLIYIFKKYANLQLYVDLS